MTRTEGKRETGMTKDQMLAKLDALQERIDQTWTELTEVDGSQEDNHNEMVCLMRDLIKQATDDLVDLI